MGLPKSVLAMSYSGSPRAPTLGGRPSMNSPGKPLAQVREVGVQRSDAELAMRAKTGDSWAEEAIFRRHARTLLKTAGRLLRDPDEAEDVVQESFVIALSEIDGLRRPEALLGWLKQITVRQVHRRFRRQKLLRLLGIGPAAAEAEQVPGGGLSPELRGELALLERVVDQLSAEDRAAWILRSVEGEALADVARLCGCSLATAKRRIARTEALITAHTQGGQLR